MHALTQTSMHANTDLRRRKPPLGWCFFKHTKPYFLMETARSKYSLWSQGSISNQGSAMLDCGMENKLVHVTARSQFHLHNSATISYILSFQQYPKHYLKVIRHLWSWCRISTDATHCFTRLTNPSFPWTSFKTINSIIHSWIQASYFFHFCSLL